MATKNAEAYAAVSKKYEWGFATDIEQDFAPKGLSEDTVRYISAKKNEPQWMLDWRLKAYAKWLEMTPPDWAKLDVPPIDYQDAYYYAEPKAKATVKSLDEIDPEILRTYQKLGIPIEEQKVLAGVEGAVPQRRVAVDAVFDSVSVATTFRAELEAAGVIFRSISEAVREFPDLVRPCWARWCRRTTIISRRSTRRSSPTAPSSTCRRACAARWSFPPISASTPPIPASSSAP